MSVTGENKPQPISQFQAAGLRPLLLENVVKSGYKVPTPVQKNAIPIIMAGTFVFQLLILIIYVFFA